MENANWIEIVIIAAVGATAKEFVSAFIRHTAKQAATLKKKVAKLAANQWHRIDGGMDILQSLFQGWLSWGISAGPERPGQMFFVAFLMMVAGFYLKLGLEKIVESKPEG
jgi:hypothetical protein